MKHSIEVLTFPSYIYKVWKNSVQAIKAKATITDENSLRQIFQRCCYEF